jgi:conjugal transfer pilin signal peptidase TrbI
VIAMGTTLQALLSHLRGWIARRGNDAIGLLSESKRRWYVLAPLALAFLFLYQRVLFNVSPSLPYVAVYLKKDAQIERGDYVVFRFEGHREFDVYLKGQWLFKRVAGVAGDRITVVGRAVFVNGQHVGFARTKTITGIPLEPLDAIVIPDGRFYVQGIHEHSFDSRYRLNGLIRRDQIMGRAVVLF